MPQGFIDKEYKKPLNFTLAEWQQAKHTNDEPRMLKALFKKTWEQSDNKESFAHSLKEHGFFLAKGDRRGYVAVDYRGEIYSLSKWTGVKTKALKQRIGDSSNLLSVSEVKSGFAVIMTEKLHKRFSRAQMPKMATALTTKTGFTKIS